MKNIVIFCVTYSCIAIGGIPGLAIDRTGIALLGAAAMVLAGAVSPADAVSAVDMPTMLLLFGLMIISSQFRLSGFYSFAAEKISNSPVSPKKLLFLLMSVTAILSALLTNDIICLAFTPVITTATLSRRINPVPFLIGLAVSANIGSAATIIGNPQNMLIGQTGQLGFGAFLLWCLPPVIASLAASYGVLLIIYKNNFVLLSDAGKYSFIEKRHIHLNKRQAAKGIFVLAAVICFFFAPVSREAVVIIAAGILLLSRTIKTVEILGFVDWQLMTLFCGLFILMKGISATGIPAAIIAEMSSAGFSIGNGYVLTGVSLLLSNIVSNVPATMLIVPHLSHTDPSQWYILALSSTFAGNLVTIGSIANLITFQIAETFGVKISFLEHAKAGIPVTIASILILFLWIEIRV